jgi:hypothetical protein
MSQIFELARLILTTWLQLPTEQNLIAYILSAFHELGHLFRLSVETITTKTYLAL